MLESVPVLQILTCLIVGILVASFNLLRWPSVLFLLCLPPLITAYRYALVGYLLSSGAVFVFAVAAARLSKSRGQAFQWRLCCLGILALVIVFLAGRWFGLGSRSVRIAGADWTLFSLDMWPVLRFVTFLWEVGSGRVTLPKIRTYAIWACLPFTLLGPVLRYSEFDSQFQKPPSTELDRGGHTWTAAARYSATPLWSRFAKKQKAASRSTLPPQSKYEPRFPRQDLLALVSAVVQLAGAVLLARLHTIILSDVGSAPLWAKLADGFVLGPWGFLLLWGGYYKLMECFAPMWGLRLPPSFNWPFGRRNISDFWANWNMTATSVFRDYLFYTRWGTRRPNLYVNTLIIFLLVGLWHGLNLYWVLFGLLHGIGFCCFIWYRQRRELKRFEITFIPGQLFGRVVTYVFVCSCWILPSQILKFFGRL